MQGAQEPSERMPVLIDFTGDQLVDNSVNSRTVLREPSGSALSGNTVAALGDAELSPRTLREGSVSLLNAPIAFTALEQERNSNDDTPAENTVGRGNMPATSSSALAQTGSTPLQMFQRVGSPESKQRQTSTFGKEKKPKSQKKHSTAAS